MTRKSTKITRAPDCVTKVHMGNTILTVSGYFKQSATETATDKMEKVIKAEESKLMLVSEQAS